jgi:hypothetical protein
MYRCGPVDIAFAERPVERGGDFGNGDARGDDQASLGSGKTHAIAALLVEIELCHESRVEIGGRDRRCGRLTGPGPGQ